MEYRKLVFGPTARYSALAVNTELGLVAVAATNGLISIYSQMFDVVHRIEMATVITMEFIRGRGTLVVFNDHRRISLIIGQGLEDSSSYSFTSTPIDIGLSVSTSHVCQSLSSLMPFNDSIALLTVDKEDRIELALIQGTQGFRTSRTSTRVHNDPHVNCILQIAETEYKEEKLTVLVLWKDRLQILRFTCQWSDPSDIGSITFELDHIVCSYANDRDINGFSITSPDSFVITTSKGEYGPLKYNRASHDLIMEEMVFPYGPFPCKSVDKCLTVTLPGKKRGACVFSGGLPAVTYVSFNTLTVAICNEPDICFTFYDRIVNFDIINCGDTSEGQIYSNLKEIVILTESELISIVKTGDGWISSPVYHFSPVSRSEVSIVSNTIELESKYVISSCEDDSHTRVFSTFHKDAWMVVWCFTGDNIMKHTEINMGAFFREQESETSKRRVLWPNFQKCGVWKNEINKEEIKMNFLKLIRTCENNIHLLCSVGSRMVFLMKILPTILGEDKLHNVETSNFQRLIKINNGEESTEKGFLTHINEQIEFPRALELDCVLTFSECLNLTEAYLDGSIIAFGGSNGVGMVDVGSGKHFYISSEELSLVESDHSKNLLPESILNHMRRKRSFTSPNLRKSSNTKSPKPSLKSKTLTVACFHMFPVTESTFDLLIGFSNGLIMVLSLVVDDSGEIIVSTNYRRFTNRKMDPAISISVFRTVHDDIPMFLDRIKKRSSLETNKTIRNSIDSAKEISLSTGSKSTILSTESVQPTTDLPKRYSMSRTMSLKWPLIGKKEPKADIILMRCDNNGVKMIDYLNLKTISKYKIKESKKIEDLNDKSPRPTILQAKIVKCDKQSNYYLILLSSQWMVFKISIPKLEPLVLGNLHGSITDLESLSLNVDSIIKANSVVINHEAVPQMMVFDEKRKAPRCRSTNKPKNCEANFKTEKMELDHEEIDFMRCADPSINSLLW